MDKYSQRIIVGYFDILFLPDPWLNTQDTHQYDPVPGHNLKVMQHLTKRNPYHKNRYDYFLKKNTKYFTGVAVDSPVNLLLGLAVIELKVTHAQAVKLFLSGEIYYQ